MSLDDRYTATAGRVLMSGIQALVRLTLDQRRLDERRGLDTRVFVTGYQGSPLGGFDRSWTARARHPRPARRSSSAPGLNEELAATAVAGTQLLGELARRRYDGRDRLLVRQEPRASTGPRTRSATATSAGTAPLGGAVALIGDDPGQQVLDAAELLRAAVPQPARCRCSRPATVAEISSSACTPSRSRAPPACGPG